MHMPPVLKMRGRSRSCVFRASFMAAILTTAAVAAQAQLEYARYFVPFAPTAAELPGSHGSAWKTELWFAYSGDTYSHIRPHPGCRFFECPDEMLVEPGRAPLPFLPMPLYANSGVILHVNRAHAHEFSFSLRVTDISRGAGSAGTEVPVVPEEDLSSGALNLIDVPLRHNYRVMLRVMGLPEVDDPVVEIRYYHRDDIDENGYDDTPVLLRTDRIPLQRFGASGEFWFQPAVARVAEVESFPEFAGSNALWIEVVPIAPNLKIWAFVSVTNNQTQQVTLVSPSFRARAK